MYKPKQQQQIGQLTMQYVTEGIGWVQNDHWKTFATKITQT